MNIRTSIKQLIASSLLCLSGLAGAGEVTCYHVLEASCPSTESKDRIGFVALTWSIKAGPDVNGYETCAYSVGRQLDFHEYLSTSEEVATLCTAGVVDRDDIREFFRARKFRESIRYYRELAKGCMDDDRYYKCVTVEELDLDHKVGKTLVLLKNRWPDKLGGGAGGPAMSMGEPAPAAMPAQAAYPPPAPVAGYPQPMDAAAAYPPPPAYPQPVASTAGYPQPMIDPAAMPPSVVQ